MLYLNIVYKFCKPPISKHLILNTGTKLWFSDDLEVNKKFSEFGPTNLFRFLNNLTNRRINIPTNSKLFDYDNVMKSV